MAAKVQGSKAVAYEPKKDAIFKGLAVALGRAGYKVRRERLKQGSGWRAVSGSCRHVGDNLIFVDKKLPQDDQIAFLVSRITSLGVTLNQDELAHLPDKWRCVIEGRES